MFFKSAEGKMPSSGSNSILYTPGVEQFPAHSEPDSEKKPGSGHEAYVPKQTNTVSNHTPYAAIHKNQGLTPKPWKEPTHPILGGLFNRAGPSPAAVLESKNEEAGNNWDFANPFGHRKGSPGLGIGVGNKFDDTGAVFVNGGLLRQERDGSTTPIPPSELPEEARLRLGSDSRLLKPPFIMPASPTDGLQ